MYYFTKRPEVKNLFPIPCEEVEMTGIADGFILKFKTFYLKVYIQNMDYLVQGFLYGADNPSIIDKVPYSVFRQYAQQFKEDNFLRDIIDIHKHPKEPLGLF